MMAKHKIVQLIATSLDAMRRAAKDGNHVWEANHTLIANHLADNYLPRGSGFDNGTHIALDKCKPGRIVFTASYHHMVEGMYSGWTDHDVIITPDFDGLNYRITGGNKNRIKKYILEEFDNALHNELTTETWDEIWKSVTG
jgi:hypothetical protein